MARNTSPNWNFGEGTHLHVANGGKRLFQSVLWKFHRLMVWNQNHWQRKKKSCHLNVGIMQQDHTRPCLFSSSLKRNLIRPAQSLLSEDLDPAFGRCKPKLGKERNSLSGKAQRGGGGVQRNTGHILVCDRSVWKGRKGYLKRLLRPPLHGFENHKLNSYFEIILRQPWYPSKPEPRGSLVVQIYLQLPIKRISSVYVLCIDTRFASFPNEEVYKLEI